MATLEAIETIYLESNEVSVQFSSIPATYDALQVRYSGRARNMSTGYGIALLRFGTGGAAVDTGSNYYRNHMRAVGTTLDITGSYASTSITPMMVTSAYEQVNLYATCVADIHNYAHPNKNTFVTFNRFTPTTPTGASEVGLGPGVWQSTAVVDSVFLKPNTGDWIRGSEFTLYGWNYT
jgi:hypothetical protein